MLRHAEDRLEVRDRGEGVGDELGGDHRRPTAITGFYSQNVPYPGFEAHWRFWFSTVLIVVLSGALYWAFRRSDWI